MPDPKRQAQQQFGHHAEAYITSAPHAKGASLDRLRTLIPAAPEARVLDVATGGGHTANLFAGRAAVVIASDLTHPMLQAARRHAAGSGVGYCQHDAEHLPYPAATFDVVTSRIAPHHFPNVGAFVHAAARVLKPGGVLAVVDNLVSGEPFVGRYVNAFEKLRDPSHVQAYTIDDWATYFFVAGLTVEHQEVLDKRITFETWVARLNVSEADRHRLRAMLLQAPEAVQAWMQPREDGGLLSFRIAEGLLIGRKA